MIEFKEIECNLPEDVMYFTPIRFEEVKRNGSVVGYIAWKNVYEPHVEYLDGVSKRAIYEVTKAFFDRERSVVVKSFIKTKNLFDKLADRYGLEFIGVEDDEFGRGTTFNYKLER